MFLPYLSSAFVPVDTLPSWLQGVARHQPVTPVIETLRGLLVGTPIGHQGWWVLAWWGGLLVVSMVAASKLFRRQAAPLSRLRAMSASSTSATRSATA